MFYPLEMQEKKKEIPILTNAFVELPFRVGVFDYIFAYGWKIQVPIWNRGVPRLRFRARVSIYPIFPLTTGEEGCHNEMILKNTKI